MRRLSLPFLSTRTASFRTPRAAMRAPVQRETDPLRQARRRSACGTRDKLRIGASVRKSDEERDAWRERAEAAEKTQTKNCRVTAVFKLETVGLEPTTSRM